MYSLIIPVYNRPDEVSELLESLVQQTYTDFEVIIVEDGSIVPCEDIVKAYESRLNIRYFSKQNEGPGLTRNYGAKVSGGEYLIFFDSDCIIPAKYMQIVDRSLNAHPLDAFGGPDQAHPSFTPVQKAISYSMTAFLTTGGIRGGKKKMDRFHPRSFNMGFSREVFQVTNGFSSMRFGEDLDMSLRILRSGFTTGLIPEAFVYHKRRTDFRKFFKQVHNSGIARINLHKRHPGSMKAVHFLPALFVIFSGIAVICAMFGWLFPLIVLNLYLLAILIDASMQSKSLYIGFLSVTATIVQHFGYGTGFIKAYWKRIILGQDEFHAYRTNFYK